MVEYIERNALIAEFKRLTLGENSLVERLFADGVYAVIETFPAADVVEVRHGRWVNENKNPVPWDECNSKCPSHSAYCSECGEWLTASDEYPVTGLYCPNCGARMDKEDEHEAG